MKVRVENMKSPITGRAIANQFIITIGSTTYFQSYRSVIVRKTPKGVTLDKHYWDYSRTTGKYRNIFLNESKKETERKIESGVYKLADLN